MSVCLPRHLIRWGSYSIRSTSFSKKALDYTWTTTLEDHAADVSCSPISFYSLASFSWPKLFHFVCFGRMGRFLPPFIFPTCCCKTPVLGRFLPPSQPFFITPVLQLWTPEWRLPLQVLIEIRLATKGISPFRDPSRDWPTVDRYTALSPPSQDPCYGHAGRLLSENPSKGQIISSISDELSYQHWTYSICDSL